MEIDVSKMSREEKIAALSTGAHEAGRKRRAQEEAQGVQRKTPVAQSRGSVTFRTKETPKASTQGNQKLQELTDNTVDSLTATAYKRQRPAASMANFQDLTPESQQGADIAQKTLEAYTNSPQRQAAMQREQDWVNARQTGQAASDQAPKDETLERLQDAARKEQAVNQERKDRAADQAVYDKDMKEISSMTDAERQQLQNYVSVRDQGATGNIFTDLFYLPREKKKAAGSLWDKYGEARLNELAETYARDIHQQTRQEVQQAAQDASQGVGGAVLTTVGGIAAKPVGAVMGLKGRLDELGQRTGRYSTLDPYTAGDAVNTFTDAAKQNVQRQIEGDGSNIFRKGAAVLYQAGTGTVENVLGTITLGPGVTAAVNATGQLTRTISEASDRGATAGQAYLLATSSAALDYAMDKIPLGQLFGLAKDGSTSALKAAFKQAGIEMTTEGASFIGSQLLDMAILQDSSEYEQNIQGYMSQGLTYADAKNQANKDLVTQAGQQMLTAGLSGGISAGVSTAIGNARNRRAQALLDAETAPESPTDTAPAETVPEQPTTQPDTTLPDTTPEPAADQLLQNPQQLQQEQSRQETPLDTVSRTVEEATTQRRAQQDAALQAVQDQAAAMSGDPNDILDSFGDNSQRNNTPDPMVDRPYSDVSKRSTKAYMYENPAVKPYYQNQAEFLLMELQDTTKGERHYDADTYYRTGGDAGITGTSRHTSASIAELLDQDGLSYDQIERGLNAIIQDNGAENNAASKKIEYIINDRLMNGYTDFYSGERVQPDSAYMDVLQRTYDPGTTETAAPSVGAADQNFTGTSRYQDLLSDDNVKPSRASDVRPDEVPEMDGSQRVSDVAKNLMGSKNTTDAGADQVKQLIDSGVFSYDPKSNKQSVQEAFDDLNARGTAAIRREIDTNLKNGVIADGDVTKAVVLANQYIQTGDEASAAEMMSDLSLLAQKSGRNLQLFSLLRRMTPEGQLDVIQQTADKMLSSNQKTKLTKEERAAVRKGQTVRPKRSLVQADIPVELKNQYIEAARSQDSARIQAATQAIAQAVGSQYHATFREKWDAWRYMCMLGNASTNVRNVAGNAFMKPYAAVKDELAAAFEKFLPQEQRTKALHTDKDLLDWAKEDVKTVDAQNALKYSAKVGADVTSDIMSENKKIFNSKILEGARKAAEWAPSAGDMVFKNGYYEKYLANFLTARGVKRADIDSGSVSPELLAQARQYAVDNAYVNTFNDRNKFSDAISSVGQWKSSSNPVTRAFGTAIDGVLPFRRTPANILVRFKEYSPVEIASAGVKLAKGKISASDFCNSLATGVTGTAAMCLGAALANGISDSKGNGVRLITKATDDEKLQGKQDYSVEVTVNGKTYSATVDWAAPANLPLFVGTNLYKAVTENHQDGGDFVDGLIRVADASKDTLEPMLSLSCLSSVNDLLENVKYSEDGSYIYKIAASAATSYLTQGIPSLLRQTATFTQTEKQTTFANDDRKAVRDVQRTLSNIPFAGDALGLKTDKIDVWGNKTSTGSVGQRAFNAYLNPSKISEVTSDATTRELSRLAATDYGTGVTPEVAEKTLTYTDKQGVTHKDVRLTASQWETYATTKGKTSKQILDSLVRSSDYAKLTDAAKAEVVKLVYSYADKQGAVKAMPDSDGLPETWMEEAQQSKNPGKYIIQKVNNQQMKSALDALTNAWAHNTERPAAVKSLEEAYTAYSKSSSDIRKAVMDAAEGTAKKYLEARSQGISSSTALSVLKQVQSIPEKNRQKAAYQYQAVAATKGLTESQQDTAMKLYMKDGSSTETKYDYIRKELGLSPKEYADAYYAYSYTDTDGDNKTSKQEAIQGIMDLGYSRQEATELYSIYNGTSDAAKKKLADFKESGE